MRLSDVNGQKCDLPLVLLIEMIEGGNLPPERRSSVAPEDEDDRLLLIQF